MRLLVSTAVVIKIFAISLFLVSLNSCSKDDDLNEAPQVQIEETNPLEIVASKMQGTWKVVSINNGEKEMIQTFDSFNMVYADEGELGKGFFRWDLVRPTGQNLIEGSYKLLSGGSIIELELQENVGSLMKLKLSPDGEVMVIVDQQLTYTMIKL